MQAQLIYYNRNSSAAITAGTEPTYAAYVKLYNVSVTGSATLNNGVNSYAGFYVYGDFAASTGNFTTSGYSNTNQTVYLAGASKSINKGSGDIQFLALNVPGSYSSAVEFVVNGNLTIGGSLTLNNQAKLSMMALNATSAITHTGTFSILSGSELAINGSNDVTLTNSLSGVAGTITVVAGKSLVITDTKTISGTGYFAINSGSTLTCGYTTGVNGVINFPSANRDFNAGANYVLTSGVTGIQSAGIGTIGNLTIGATGATTTNITTSESFIVTGDIKVKASSSGISSFVASAGTITMTPSAVGKIIQNDETVASALTFYNLTIAGVAPNTVVATVGAGAVKDFYVAGSLVHTTTSTFNFAAAATTKIYMTGTGNLTLTGTTTCGFIYIDQATSNITLGGNINTGAGGSIYLNNASATFDAGAYTIIGTKATTPFALDLQTGTFKTSIATGVAGNITHTVAGTVNVMAAMKYYYSGAIAASLGFRMTDADCLVAAGTGASATEINLVGGITVASTLAAGITTHGTTNVAFTCTGAFTVNTGSKVDFGTVGTTVAVIFDNGSSIVNNGTLIFDDLTIGNGVGIDIVSTSSSFTVAGDLSVDGTGAAYGRLNCSNGTITMTAANGAQVITATTAANGILNFNNLTFANANAITSAANLTSINVAGNIVKSGAGALTLDVLNVLTMSGTGASITKSGAGIVTLGELSITGSVTATSATADLFSLSHATTALSVLAGKSFVASSGLVDITGTTTDIATGGTITLYNLTTTSVVTSSGGGTITITNNYTNVGAGTTFAGETVVMTAAAGTASITSTATDTDLSFGTLTIAPTAPANVTVTAGNAFTVATAMTINANTTLILDGTVAPQITGGGTFATSSGSTISWDGADVLVLAGAGVLDASLVETMDPGTNYIVGAAVVTDAGLDLVDPVGNVTINSTALAALGATGAAVSVGGNITVGNGAVYNPTITTEAITMTGTDKTINVVGTGALSFGTLVVTGTVTSTASFNVTGTANANDLRVNGGSLILSSPSVVTMGGATAQITNSGTLKFYDLTIGALVTDVTASASDFEIKNNLTMVSTATPGLNITGGTLTLSSANTAVITTLADYNVKVNNLLISGSYTQTGNHIIDVNGTSLNCTGTFTQTAAQGVNFITTGATIANTGSLTLGDLVVDRADAGTRKVSTTSSFNIAGDITLGVAAITDAFEATAGTISFTGAGTITPRVHYNATTHVGVGLFGVNVTGAETYTGDFKIGVNGDFTVATGGSFIPFLSGTGMVLFDGTGTKTITNSGTLTFGDFNIANTTGNNVVTASDFTVDGNFNILGSTGGTFVASSGTVTFTVVGGAAASIYNLGSTAATVTFYNLTLNSANSLVLYHTASTTDEIYIKGSLTNAGTGLLDFTYAAGGGNAAPNSKVWFNGLVEQNLSASSTGDITFGYMTVNNLGAGVKLSGLSASTGAVLTAMKTLKVQKGYVDLNGDNIITLDASAGTLQEVAGNTVRNGGSTAAVGYIVKAYTPSSTLSNVNVGGLGAQLTTAIDPGVLTIKRFHIARTVAGESGITRSYSITNSLASGSVNLTFKYDTTELNGITEANLALLSSTDALTWIKRTATLDAVNHYMRGTFASDFNANATTTYWTASAPSQVTISKLAKGVGSLRFNDGRLSGNAISTDTLTSSTTRKALVGFRISTTNAAQVNAVVVKLSRTITNGTEFSKFYLYSSTDDDYATTSDNDSLAANITFANDTCTFNNLSLDIPAGGFKNYYIAADIGSTLTTATLPVTASILSSNITLANSIMLQSTVAGPVFKFQPGITIAKVVNGVAESPLPAGLTNQAIYGFSATSTTASSFTTFTLSFDQDTTTLLSVFNNTNKFRLYRSTSKNFDINSVGQNTLLSTTALNTSNGVKFSLTSAEVLSAVPIYYFIVADVKGGVNPTTVKITPSIAQTSLHSYVVPATPGAELAGPISTSTIDGATYEFVNSKISVNNTGYQIPTGNIGRGLSSQRLFGFTLTSDNGNSVEATGASFKVDLTNGAVPANFSNWRLWYDANENSYPDAGEANFAGVYTNGYVTFPMSLQSFSTSRKYIVSANVVSTTTDGSTITLSIPDQSYISASSPAMVVVGGPWTGNIMTIKNPGVAKTLVLSPQYKRIITTGDAIAFTYQLLDADNIPTKATTPVTLNLTAGAGSGLTPASGTITVGSDFGTVTSVVTNATGTTSESITCTPASAYSPALTNPSATNSIVIYPAKSAVTVTTPGPISAVADGSLSGTVLNVVYTATNIGSPAYVTVVMRAGALPVAPTDGQGYTSITNIGNATASNMTGYGSYVVYDGTGASNQTFNVSGLTPGVTYYFTTYVYTATSGLQSYSTALNLYNPISASTSASGSFDSHATSTTPATIQTDVDVNGTIATANEQAWYKFFVNDGRGNLYIHLTDLTADKNLKVELWNSTGTKMIRYAKSLSSQNQTILINDLAVGSYLIKVTGYDATQYSSAFKLRVNTKATVNDYFTQPSR